RPVDVFAALPLLCERTSRRLVLRFVAHRLFEDGWVRCDARDAITLRERAQFTRAQHRASDRVEPDALAFAQQGLRRKIVGGFDLRDFGDSPSVALLVAEL